MAGKPPYEHTGPSYHTVVTFRFKPGTKKPNVRGITHALRSKLIGDGKKKANPMPRGVDGGYDVALFAAHLAGQPGIVAINAVNPLVDGRVRARVKNKTAIADGYGFKDPRVVGHEVVVDQSLPLRVQVRDPSEPIKFFGKEYRAEREGTPAEWSEANDNDIVGSYKLVKA